jgi:membrane associated rhomboid family serine protease
MRPWFNRSGAWLGRDDIAIYLLVIANIVIFGLCVARAMPGPLNAAVLLQAGAIHPSALSKGEIWRLVAHGFLHINPLHLGTNMLCLVVFGGPLIRRVKTLYFLLIYLASVAAGGAASIYAHEGPFLSVGASGGVAGLLGASAGLWLLGRPAVSPAFLAATIGLNVVLSATVANIDWASHLGGFAGGLIACAALDLVEKLNGRMLQCKFPEFVKVNGIVLLCAPAIAVLAGGWLPEPGRPADGLTLAIGYAAVCLGLIKLADLVLPLKKGLAVVIGALALGNAAMIWVLGTAYYAPTLAGACWRAIAPPPHNPSMGFLCERPHLTVIGAAVVGLLLTLVLYSWDLRRGLNDVGFIGATLKANRRRSYGL